MPRPFRVHRFDLLVVAMVGAFLWSLFASLGGDLGGYEPLPSDAEGAGARPLGWMDLSLLDLESGRVDPRLAKFDGKLVRVPGYIVPLEDFQARDVALPVGSLRGRVHPFAAPSSESDRRGGDG